LGGGRGDTVTGSVKDFPRPAIIPPAKPSLSRHTPTAAELASANPATQQAALSKLAELAKLRQIPQRVRLAGEQLRLTGPKATRTGWLKDNWGKIATTLTLLGAGGELTRRLTKDEAATVAKANGILEGMKDQPVNAEVDARLSEEEGTVVDKNGEVKEKRFSGRDFYLRRATIHKEFVQENLAAGSDLSSLDAEGASEKLYDMARYHDGIVTFSPRANKFVVVDPRTWREVKKWSHRQKQRYDKDNRLKANMERVRGNLPYYENLAEKKRQRNVNSRIKELRRKGGRITEIEMDELHSLQTGQTDRTHPMRLLKMGAFNNKNGTVNWGEYRKYEALHETKKTERRPYTEQEKIWGTWRKGGSAFAAEATILAADISAAAAERDFAELARLREKKKALEKKAQDAEEKFIASTADMDAGPEAYADPRHDDRYKTPLHRMIDTIKSESVAVEAGPGAAPDPVEEGEPEADPLKLTVPETGKQEDVAPPHSAVTLDEQFRYLGKGETREEDAANLRALVAALESDPELAPMFERWLRTEQEPLPPSEKHPKGVEGRVPIGIKKYLDGITFAKRKTKHGTKEPALDESLIDLKIQLYQAFGLGLGNPATAANTQKGMLEKLFTEKQYDIPDEHITPEMRKERHADRNAARRRGAMRNPGAR
jgi:hypothetical protein